MVIFVFFLVISVNRRLFRYFGSYSGISVIPVILVNRRTALQLHAEIVMGRVVPEPWSTDKTTFESAGYISYPHLLFGYSRLLSCSSVLNLN